jgi:regulation of enolase protein 1 (concanavalin A-like superfamily)
MTTEVTGRDGFGRVMRAEWVSFRSARSWVIAVIVALIAVAAFGSLKHYSCAPSGTGHGAGSCATTTGPGGEAVQDAFYFARQSLAGNGTITAAVTSLSAKDQNGSSGLQSVSPPSWSKAGIIIKENTSQGSEYAAIVVTGSHGVQMEWNYVNGTSGLAGSASAAAPRWLRLVRNGDTVTGYDSADGTSWTQVGTASLPGLSSTVQAGLLAASPKLSFSGSSAGVALPVLATGVFQHVSLSWTAAGWTGTQVGSPSQDDVLPGMFSQSGGTLTVSGSGDIAPASPDGGTSLWNALQFTYLGLLVLVVVGALFGAAEYGPELIRVPLATTPRRGRLLAARAVVIGTIGFAVGLLGAVIAMLLGEHTLTSGGNMLLAIPAATEVRMAIGTALLLAVASVIALAFGAILRSRALAIVAAVVVIFGPYVFVVGSSLLQPGTLNQLLRFTPAAAFALQQPFPAYSQVVAAYTPVNGFFPLAPWAGFAVECAWAVAALALAFYLLRRRDARSALRTPDGLSPAPQQVPPSRW